MVIGDDKKYLSALITFRTMMDGPQAAPTNELTPEVVDYIKENLGSTVKTTEDAIKDSAVLTYIQKCVDETNTFSISRAAQVRKFKLLPAEFTIAGGEMTPTMKLKRKFTEKKFAEVIDQLYAEAKL